MALDSDNHSKGFAFVEFEEEVRPFCQDPYLYRLLRAIRIIQGDATRALGANNYELKKRRIAVTLSDTRVRSRRRCELSTTMIDLRLHLISEPETGLGRKADARNRSLRIRDLPDDTAEGLLQQAVEKLAPVNRLEVFLDKREAVVEFQSAAEAARLLLLPEPLEFNGVQLRFSEGDDTPAKAHGAPKTASGMFIPRTAASRPRAGLGRARKPPPAAGTTAAPESQSQTSSEDKAAVQGKAQDDFRKMLLGGK
jgi:hypothetical protein